MCYLPMMKNQFRKFVCLWIFTGTAFAQMGSYSYSRKVEGIESNNYYAIPIDPATASRMSFEKNDVRLYRVGTDTAEVPYLFESFGRKVEKTEMAFDVVNQSYNAQGWYYFTFEQPQVRKVNYIELHFQRANFDLRIDLEGSMDQRDWRSIEQNARIVSLQNEFVSYEYTTLHFTPSNYKFFQVVVKSADPSWKLHLETASVYDWVERDGRYDELPIGEWKQEENKKDHISEVILPMKAAYPVSQLTMKIKNEKDYYRSLKIYYSKELVKTERGEIENWIYVSDYMISSLEPVRVDLGGIKTDKIKLQILNRNDQPLAIEEIHLKSEACRMIAELESGKNYFLAYGKSYETAPQYDLVYFKEKIPSNVTEAHLGVESVIEKIIEPKGTPLFENPLWLWSIMIVVILLIGGYSIKMLKTVKKN